MFYNPKLKLGWMFFEKNSENAFFPPTLFWEHMWPTPGHENKDLLSEAINSFRLFHHVFQSSGKQFTSHGKLFQKGKWRIKSPKEFTGRPPLRRSPHDSFTPQNLQIHTHMCVFQSSRINYLQRCTCSSKTCQHNIICVALWSIHRIVCGYSWRMVIDRWIGAWLSRSVSIYECF
jgi:hypothetical protein